MITTIIITSLFCIGFKIATKPDFILSFIGKFFTSIQQKYIAGDLPEYTYYIIQPLFFCIYCMSSVYSIIFYSIFEVYSLHTLYELPIMIVCVCGLNGVLDNLLNIR